MIGGNWEELRKNSKGDTSIKEKNNFKKVTNYFYFRGIYLFIFMEKLSPVGFDDLINSSFVAL